jgi:polyphosphate kinase 2 (PPK2 family)
MKLTSKEFIVSPGKKLKLNDRPTKCDPFYNSPGAYKDLLEHHVRKLSKLQQLHYASNRHALLIIFKGMDAAGKHGTIRHVMSGVNPEWCEVFSSHVAN